MELTPFNERPTKVQLRMLECQKAQGKPSDSGVFMENICRAGLGGGFDWMETKEGFNAWKEAIYDDDYTELYIKNPNLKPVPAGASPSESDFLNSIDIEKLRSLDLNQYDANNNRAVSTMPASWAPLCADLFGNNKATECRALSCVNCPLFNKQATRAFLFGLEMKR